MPTQTKPALPFAPYEGAEPYIFVSYAHANADRVYPVIARLHGMGYRLWYDGKIVVGEEWPEVIADKLIGADCMLLFLTPEAVASEWVRKEIHAAIEKKIKIIGTFLMETNLPSALFLQLANVQMVLYEDETYWERLCEGIPKGTLGKKAPPQKRVYRIRQRPKHVDVPISSRPKSEPEPTPSPEYDFEWKTEKDGTLTVIKYKGQDTDIVIPSIFQRKRVAKIGSLAFYHHEPQIKTVHIPEGVSALGSHAFALCQQLSRVTIPNSVQSIDFGVFQCCSKLNHVSIPKGVKSIESATFLNCINLSDIAIPASVISICDIKDNSAGYGAFYDKHSSHNPNLTFRCPRGSYAEEYAKEHNINITYTD